MRNWPACLDRFLARFLSFKFLWRLRIANLIRIEVNDAKRCAVFYFANSQIMQERPPAPILFEVVGDAFGHQNVAGIATIHHALGDVNTGSVARAISRNLCNRSLCSCMSSLE